MRRVGRGGRRVVLRRSVVVLAGAVVAAAPAQAALTWDPNGAAAGAGGSGVWDTSSPQWFDGLDWIAWNNAAPQQAVFVAPAGTVSLNAASLNTAAGIALSAGY